MRWDEVKGALDSGRAERLEFEFRDVLGRVGRDGDLWSKVITCKQELPKSLPG